MKGMKLGGRWSRFRNAAHRKQEANPRQNDAAATDQILKESLPEHLGPEKVRLLLQGKNDRGAFHKGNNDELEHLIERAVYHQATLKQLKERVSKEKDNAWFESNLEHSFEHWSHYLRTLEMIAQARKSLQYLQLPEKRAVQEARASIPASARHPVPLE